MLLSIAIIQGITFLLFFILEKKYPARHLPRNSDFYHWWLFAQVFSIFWLKIIALVITMPTEDLVKTHTEIIQKGLLFFFVYSFFNYWWHRFKHQNPTFWHYIHRFHHVPSKMETALIFFKHPLEIVANSLLIFTIAWALSLPIESVAFGLLVEGIIETYHHANIKTPKKLRWISVFIQTPEMHLIHHQRGLHKYNYVTFLWDTVFKTSRIPEEWDGELGLALKNGSIDILWCRKK